MSVSSNVARLTVYGKSNIYGRLNKARGKQWRQIVKRTDVVISEKTSCSSSKFSWKETEEVERLSMTFTADGKRQRLPLIFYSFLVILK